MIDFIEYVVAELKSRRLSKNNAVELVRQFSSRSPSAEATSAIHPLLHRNTSDLCEQRYSSTFTGGEFFLTDHQVAVRGQEGQKMMPGVAYLEMARAAVEQAWPSRPQGAMLELRSTVWAQPIVVADGRQISIALMANENDEIDYEIYSEDSGQEVIHCQGCARWNPRTLSDRLNLEHVRTGIGDGQMEAKDLYAACAQMGLLYGPAFQAITIIHRGSNQVLARLRLPGPFECTVESYVLHPSLMDGALQACAGLMEGVSEAAQAPRLPFALESLRIISPCVPTMLAWVRYAPGNQASDRVIKLDIDLCDEQGNVCVQMRGFSSRVLGRPINAAVTQEQTIGRLLAAPVWQSENVVVSATPASQYAERHIILCDLKQISAPGLEALLPGSRCLSLPAEDRKNIAQRYSDYALACFERIQAIFRIKPQSKVLIQIVAANYHEQALFAGLSGLLKTAALENPIIAGQLVLVTPEMTTEQLATCLQKEESGHDSLIRYEQGVRQVPRWQEISPDPEKPPVAFRDHGVYLITGGLGGLGTLFAKEILCQTRQARVVLTGRGMLDEKKRVLLDELSAHPGRVSYRQVDLCDLEQVKPLIDSICAEYGQLNGILHSAGMIADNFILKKDAAEFAGVLAPKVAGTFNLDQASCDVELDFFVMFSAAAAMGSPGQADYASANAFIDQFAAYRNTLVATGQRHGRTRSINWGLWQAGGMSLSPAAGNLMPELTGMQPMQTSAGLDGFYRSLALPGDQMLVIEGDRAKLRKAMLAGPAVPSLLRRGEPAPEASFAKEDLAEKTQQYLRRQFSGLLKLPADKIDPRAALEQYGIDSILALKLTSQLEKTFGPLSKTLFFEYQTVHELTDYFVSNFPSQLTGFFASSAKSRAESMLPAAPALAPEKIRPTSSRRSSRRRNAASAAPPEPDAIAIIGLSGRYPEAVDIETYWQNLCDGKDCIIEVPKERWDWRAYFTDDRTKAGHHYSKWGGFIEGVDEFDALFFNISPLEAEYIDPQERLFLQHAWIAVEDAGYTRAGLQVPQEHDLPGQVGVYVGVMYSEYQLFGAEASASGKRMGLAGSVASIANRVSYALNLHGPSITLDTMCSSSLSAIHVACQDLMQGRTSMAIAGGVNVSIHPSKYLVLSAGQFISGDGHCQSFGEGGDGYIPGEGVGVVILKRLSNARRDGDHIYGIIRGSALNHGGKTNGYSVPNPQAQATAIARALKESKIDARHISYIEAHGTGTRLGDPIEITALNKAFQQYTQETGFCLIGSAKSNIGHCESAAGIAGLTKVLLQMQHRQIVPSLHSERLNPHIDFAKSPFVVNQSLKPWEQPVIDGRALPRIAGISSFGAGGSNAHLIVEEYQAPERPLSAVGPAAVLLSARTPAQLRQKARDLLAFVRPRVNTIDLAAMSYTLQVGREAMEERLAFIVNSAEQLVERLEAFVAGNPDIDDLYQGEVKRNREALSLFSGDADLQQTVDKWIAGGKLPKLLDLWAKGLDLDWSKLYGDTRPLRMSLPAYPFARERYWVDTGAGPAPARATATTVLHPLLHSNTSDLSEQRYSSTFTGEEFFLADHQISANGNGHLKVLPGVAYLEMARAAVEQASPRPDAAVLELHNTVWARPIIVSEKTEIGTALLANDDDQLDFEIYTGDGEEKIVHCQGRACWGCISEPGSLDLEALKVQMQEKVSPSSVYEACSRLGLLYGPSLQAMVAIHRGDRQALAELQLPKTIEQTSEDYVLHPSLLDGALQSCVALLEEQTEPGLPFALESLRIFSSCNHRMFAWARYSPDSYASAGIVKLDIDLCDDHGKICAQLRGFSTRIAGKDKEVTTVASNALSCLYAAPVWLASNAEILGPGTQNAYIEHHVILCELPQVSIEQLEPLLPQSQCLPLWAAGPASIAQRYSDYALVCFERIQTILRRRPEGKVLFQVVAAGHQEQALFTGLAGLLKTAALENPRLVGQFILTTPETTARELVLQLQAEKSGMTESLVQYEDGVRKVMQWQELVLSAEQPPVAFKDRGVYLITGGLGSLGILFTKEILRQTRGTKVVLTGRSPFNAGIQAQLESLSTQADQVTYRQLDLNNLDQVRELVVSIQSECGGLDGILHSAGMIADNFIVKKTGAEFAEVLAPKVIGPYNLDEASREIDLDFVVLFSSAAGAVGNPGQADYAAANAFMDQFAAWRNRLVAAKQRRGLTRSINWGLWQEGGMGIDAVTRELLRKTTGTQPIQTTSGIAAFYRSLILPCDQLLVAEGDREQMRRALLARPIAANAPEASQSAPAAGSERERLVEKAEEFLRRELADVLKLPSHKIDPQAALENYGIDSVLAMKLTNQLEQTFGSLSKTLFFEYQTIAALAGYFVKAHPDIVQQKTGLLQPAHKTRKVVPVAAGKERPAPAQRGRNRFAASRQGHRKDIAIIGLAGKYPQAETLQEFWSNLQSGRDCITEIPSDRWDHKLYFEAEPRLGKSYSKWGGFISDVDKFDPLFFNITPKEAELTDPQERLFLQTAWETIEDAGYTKEKISGKRVGVFVGVMWAQYELFGAESILSGETAVPNSSHSSIANRVSYFFDLRGPSIALDTMCSSSLTAIHMACEELQKGELEAAIAGGVNVTIHPYKYLSLSQGRFAASDGRCRSFGQGGDGYVPGEGVGAILLKPLDSALRDGDQIYGVIRSSAVNHGGKTNGYTVPNPGAQADLILDALKKAKINPETLGYLETHGTGTSLGDPIEVAGLSRAFEGFTGKKRFCSIGSVKSNIGHLEAAAGIAAVTKVLFQLRYKQLAPSIHADPLNPNIDFESSPFYVQTELAEWKQMAANPRRAGVSSFGAGGSNAHLIIEEYLQTQVEQADSTDQREIFVLSARDTAALARYAEKLVAFLETAQGISFADVAYTSQVGRTPMDARLAIIASSLEDLRDKLNRWVALHKSDSALDLEDVFYGNVREAQHNVRNLIAGEAGKGFLEGLLVNRNLEKIAGFFVIGIEMEWPLLHRGASPRRISLPTYAFAKEHCWIKQVTSVRFAQKRAPEVRTTPAPGPIEEKQRACYVQQWIQNALPSLSQTSPINAPVLILDSSEGLFLAIKECPGCGPVVLVKPGTEFAEIGQNIFTVDTQREETFQAFVGSLKSRSLLPGIVIHQASQACNLEIKEQVDRQLNEGVYTLLHLCKALMREKHQKPFRIVSAFSHHPGTTAPLAAAMGAFFKTLTLENPGFLAKVVDIQSQSEDAGLAIAQEASLVWDEICAEDWKDNEIRYRGGEDAQEYRRYVSRLTPETIVRSRLPELPLKENGVYLITGGLGGLGLIFAEYLAKNFKAKLVLTGRSTPGARQEEMLNRLRGHGAEAVYIQADVSSLEDMQMVMREARTRFLEIHGIIHSAGVNCDAFILKKTREEMESVLAPKVHGAINLDLATRDENLDLFVLFSSVAGVMGNVGQCDYAFGNHFLDSFAEERERLRKAEKRSGRTLSINWPLWEAGGMSISQADIALLESRTGVCPLPAREGLRFWEDLLRSEASRGIALYGRPSKIAGYIDQRSRADRKAQTPAGAHDATVLFARTEEYLKALVGSEIGLAPERIDSTDRLESFGIESVMINRINTSLERDLGELPKTLLYEHETVRDLAKYLVKEVHEALVAMFGIAVSADESSIASTATDEGPVHAETLKDRATDELEPIAIIGIHGYFPQSENLDEYWENLKQSRDLIDLVPRERWNYEEYYHPDPKAAAEGKIYCKWGGFLRDYDKFDPQFFNISVDEAKIMDPQERLFLQSVWSAIEDAGYTRDTLRKRFPKDRSADVGVFAGVTTNSYHLWAPEERSRGNIVYPSAMPWSIANRVSYFFDFNGPSMPVDTACSSSLVALHLACESLRNRQCQLAIAGGVNLYLHPSKYQSLCQRRMLSLEGKCHSYGSGDDGFVPGEGVGTLVLKPLSKAIADQDRIYAVIPVSAFEHSGRSNGYSAPNPNSQASLISQTLSKANIHPETISYVEGHGTGTQLGDSLEIAALTQAFQKQTAKKQFCSIGSVKANIGHSESAAGVAELSKVILQIKHRQLAPSIYSEEVNPNIDFKESPFYLQHGLSEWKPAPGQPRRALINSFGAGGVNACAVLEEYETAIGSGETPQPGPCVFTLSAKNEDRLREYADCLLAHLRKHPGIDLTALCYTLQTGREAMSERLATIVRDVSELFDRLSRWINQESVTEVYRGSLASRRPARSRSVGSDQDLGEIASIWVEGNEVSWESLYPQNKPRRIGLPTYPFARERYWISDSPITETGAAPSAQLHPLISYNSSTLREISFTSTLPETAFYAVDHKVFDEAIFPGAGFLEMACIAGNIAGEQRVHKIRDIVWARPLIFERGPQTLCTALKPAREGVEYVISSLNEENEASIHSEGRLIFRSGRADATETEDRVPIQGLKEQCASPQDGAAWYDKFRQYGFNYGPSFQTIQEIYTNDSFALSKLKIADHLKSGFSHFILHPSMIDGALQTVAGLAGGLGSATPHLPFALDEVVIIHPIRRICYAYAEFADPGEQSHAGGRKFNIQLLNENGDVLVRFRNLFVRALSGFQTASHSQMMIAGH